MTDPQQPGPPPPTYGPYGSLNPYGGGTGTPVPPPAPPQPPVRGKRRTTAVIAAVVAALLAAGGGTWYALKGDEGPGARKDDKASASPTASGPATPSAGPSGPPAPDAADAARYNGARAPGEASVLWVRKNDIDVTTLTGDVFGPWLVGDTLVTAMYRTVTAHSVVDGTVKWRMMLDTEICRASHDVSADGKIVLARKDRLHADVDECRNLQAVDLRTGRTSWQRKIVKEGNFDFGTDFSLAISGGTVTAGRDLYSTGYRLSDGKQLFGRWEKNECQPYAYAGGPKLIAAVSCTKDVNKPQEEIHEVDPVTGKSRWKYRLPVGYRVDHVLSVRPLVVSADNRVQGTHGMVVLNEDGTKRTSLKGPGFYAEGCDDDTVQQGNLQRCQVVVDGTTAYIAVEGAPKGKGNEIAAFDLRTGNIVRRIEGLPGRRSWPLRMEGGSLIVRRAALLDAPGSLATVAPGATRPVETLRLPRATGRLESRFHDSPALYVDGRYILVQQVVLGANDDEEMKRETLLAFGK
ncbi:PQQ-like beta-propeller repeat protein [Streptomyces sp. Je 1-79]|uniref:PQQ-like beta-propeller repeat protein n=1 Tax=Streptomyces sp. Je 1-79 TaxID=2943847 RepID=UPI0021A70F6B|nr:PQQ-like beta-propeller repeat protein [Streptomyces sp. Je 1-79]MCT4356464.1 PQQ-like beta-propeller repeat protein [Streptomyces sp. Je 1-79]